MTRKARKMAVGWMTPQHQTRHSLRIRGVQEFRILARRSEDIGYGDNWDETLTVGPVAVSQTDSDYTYASWDYYVEGDYLQDQFSNVLAVRDSASLTVDWTKSGQSYTGLAYGSWVDLNENGVQRTNPEDPNFHACEDFDNDGNYDEAEYFGDRSDQGNYIVWFDSESIVKSVVLDLTHIVIQNRTSEEPQEWRDECTSLADAEVTLTWRFTSNGDGVQWKCWAGRIRHRQYPIRGIHIRR